MKSFKYIKSTSEQKTTSENSFELLMDPMRSKIIFEIILKGETTAEKLAESTKKSRSTISHHLKKLVEAELLEVIMNPTGKLKYYKLTENIRNFMYTFDKEKFSSGDSEEKSAFIIDMFKMFTTINLLYSNILSDQTKFLEENQPFDEISLDENKEIVFKIGKKKTELPFFNFFLTGENEASFIRNQLTQLLKNFHEYYLNKPKETIQKIMEHPKYIVNLQILSYTSEKEIK